MFILLFVALLITAVVNLLLWVREKQNYWSKRGIVSNSSSFYYFGRNEHVARLVQRIYRNFKHTSQRFVGIHLLFQPTVVVTDLELIKQMLITDFESFPDRGLYHNGRDDPLTGNLVRLDGEPWKRLRTKLTPVFTSAKLRYMYSTFLQVGERLTQVVNELVQDRGAVLELRDLCARYTTDIIGVVAFGIECESLREPHTEFRIMGEKAFKSHSILLETFAKNFTQLSHKLRIKIYPNELIQFFSKVITQNIEYRERNQVRRNDFLDILIELKNTLVDGEFVLTLQEIIGQSFIFFVAGYETSSSTMSFCLYELSQNSDIQQRARKEVLECLKRHDNQLSYECLQEMKYLDQVLAETLRKYPVFPLLNRVTHKDYPVPETNHIIEAGVPILIPVHAIHHDPKYYTDPEKFDPERFTNEALQQRHPMSYLPFGAGQRFCIGDRFGKVQTKLGIALLLSKFSFSITKETPKVLDFDIKALRIYSIAGGIPLRVTRI